MNTARNELAAAKRGTTSAALGYGGQNSVPAGSLAITEEWNSPSSTTKTISTD